MPNRLAHETSPYLLQHAHNPVDWYPWGPEALERSRQEDKPILLSIGYAACHWCHVMAHESFENGAIAEQMNQDFVCIKVDREERPDLDDIYMTATVAMSGSGGWPMTVFLTPEKLPFFAGTYFPPSNRYGRPGFPHVLSRIAELWRSERPMLLEQATELATAIREQARVSAPGEVGFETIERAARSLEAAFDPRFGGFGAAPKFPPSRALELLLRHHARTGNEPALQMVRKTLDGMKDGGIYDHLGGGFARYSVDERWHVPHFEKMLYDNAELVRVYTAAYQVTADPEYARVIRETLDFAIREMQSGDGGFYSAFDADSEGEEGKFYVWSRDELDTILEREAADHFAFFYDVTAEGNWEGTNVLRRRRTLGAAASELGLGAQALEMSLADARQKLFSARKQRTPPLLDDKTLTAWNGLMIGAMAEAARVLGEARYLEASGRAADYVLGTLRRPDAGLYRTARKGQARLAAYLEDYAYVTDALVTLYEAGGAERYLESALELAERMLTDFGDEADAAFFFTAREHEALLARTREGHDGALPNPNSVAAQALARLSVHFDRPDLRKRAVSAINAYGGLAQRSPRAFASLLSTSDFLGSGPLELVVSGDASEPHRQTLQAEIARHYLPNRVLGYADAAQPGRRRPLIEGKGLVGGKSALFVCRDYVCQAPIVDVDKVPAALLTH